MTISITNGGVCAITAPSLTGDVRRARRTREFYRYLQPDNLVQPHLRRRSSTFDVHHDHIPSLADALAPYCQLACLRCNTSKAMLNVMDGDIMYFLAEASMKAKNTGEQEIYEDPIFITCSGGVPIEGRICEMTLKLGKPDDPSQVPTFVIPDLSKSSFAHMDIVTGSPHFRFYAGVPITTRSGINIGSLAIMDTAARPDGLTSAEVEFLGRTAGQIMTYLETNRQAIEGRRARRMAEGLEAFIAGKKTIVEEGPHQTERASKRRARAAYGISVGMDQDYSSGHERSSRNKVGKANARSNSIISLESEISNSAQSTDADDQQNGEAEGDTRSHSKTFSRAANLLRECMGDLGEDGSVHVIQLATRLGSEVQKSHSLDSSDMNSPKVRSMTDNITADPSQISHSNSTRSRIIASSTAAATVMSDSEGLDDVSKLHDEFLQELVKRYPGGRLWILDDSGGGSSEDDVKRTSNGNEPHTTRERSRRSSRRKQSELTALRVAFPAARQLIFTPVWDATTGSFAHCCFTTTSLETRSFSAATEIPFLNSFCSTVMAECSRLDTMLADRQKSDFVGTISHEMRSPLHGVLASVEFLAETNVDSFQRSLIETIDSCGRTLLDTINHVLDYSKVNSFQKQWQTTNKRGNFGSRRANYLVADNPSKAVSQGAPPLLQLTGVTDVSAVLEEVIDGLVLGHTYSSGVDITDVSREARGRTGSKAGSLPSSKQSPVEIILDIQQGDWTFLTQPGAVRRIIMNITGNAIKYTNRGRIAVKLQQKDSTDGRANTRVMVFTVTDTGKGISAEFLASRLFVPFAQENALAPGTGLGMSIVRSIVLMLGGTIDVKSRVGEGTTVEVALPMARPMQGQMSTQTTPHSGGTGVSANSNGDESITLLRNQAVGETVTFYRQKPVADDIFVSALQYYVKEWYHLDFVDQRLLESSSIVIVEEGDLEQLMTKAIGTPGKRPALVVLCTVSSRNSTALITALEQRLSSPVEFVAKPCGPNKLARSLRQVLAKKKAIKPRTPHVANLGMIPEAITPLEVATPLRACDGAGKTLQDLDLSTPGEPGPVVHATEHFAASQVSHHAQMAIHDPSEALRTPKSQMSDCNAFPFPSQNTSKTLLSPERVRARGTSLSKQRDQTTPAIDNVVDVKVSQSVTIVAPASTSSKISPRVLLVDDNKINLKLLETFLKKKRNYKLIEKAEDGQQAVNAVKAAEDRFDIVFMDISMPVMNGFEATRAIRDYEAKCKHDPGAMIIALTGLASGRDQSEGFDSGCDIYMTKPVSFKEVGRLLDNWEGHQLALMDQEVELNLNGVKEDMAAMRIAMDSAVGVQAASVATKVN